MVMKVLSYILQNKFVDREKFRASPSSNIVDNLTEGIHKFK